MLETLREYAREKLERQSALVALRERAALHFLEKAERWAEQIASGDDADAVAQMTRDVDNLRAGMDWGVQRDDWQLISAYGRALARFFLARGLYGEGGERLQAAEEASRRADDRAALAHILLQRGRLAFQQSDLALARRVVTESYEISRALDDRPRQAAALLNLGNIAWGESRYDEAQRFYREGLDMARETPDGRTRYEAILLANLGLLASDQGDLEAADRYFADGLALHQRNHNQSGIAYTLMNSSDVLRLQGQFGPALDRLEESHRLFTALGHQHEKALTSVRIGLVLLESGRIDAAEPHLEEGLQIAREIEDHWSEMYGMAVQGRIAAARSRPAQALDLFRRSFALAERVGDRKHRADILNHIGQTLLENGQAEAAYRALGAAYGEYAALNLPDAEEIAVRLNRLRAALGAEIAARLDAAGSYFEEVMRAPE